MNNILNVTLGPLRCSYKTKWDSVKALFAAIDRPLEHCIFADEQLRAFKETQQLLTIEIRSADDKRVIDAYQSINDY